MARRGPKILVVGALVLLAGCNWPMFRGDPAHDGFNGSEDKISATNVSTLVERFEAAPGSGQVITGPVVVDDVVYVVTEGTPVSHLEAFDAAGVAQCTDAPRACAPLWTATLPGDPGTVPTVSNGVVYVAGGSSFFLDAFDAAGTTNCSGTPKGCTPLWTGVSPAGGGDTASSPNVVNGVVYVGNDSPTAGLLAFDASGVADCSGTPKVCDPLWTGSVDGNGLSSPAVADGTVYVGDRDGIAAFDAAGAADCSGAPTGCTPLWTVPVSAGVTAPPAVGGGVLYVPVGTGALEAYDPAGSTDCSGSPKVCAAMWSDQTNGLGGMLAPPAIAYGHVYTGDGNGVYAFDGAGSTNCAGAPKVCSPLWTGTGMGMFTTLSTTGPIVANGVVYASAGASSIAMGLYAFDAAGRRGCSGTPTVCSPLFSFPTTVPVFTDPAVANGSVYFAPTPSGVIGGSPDLYALGLPAGPGVVQQPQSQTAAAGRTLTFTALATGAPGPTVQWQLAAAGSSTWTDIAGATTGSYTTASLSQSDDGASVRAVFTNARGSAITNPATITVS